MNYRVCLNKADGKLIEMQSGGETQEHLNTLKNNALSYGFTEDQVEIKFVDEAGWQAILQANAPVLSTAEKRRNAYRAAYSVDEFQEAVCEQLQGRPEKMNALLQKRSDIRQTIS